MSRREQTYSVEDFQWAPRSIDMKEFSSVYRGQAPFLFVVTSGWLGRDESLHGVSSETMCWFHDITKQSRLVVRNHEGQYMTVPMKYKTRVIPMDGNLKDMGPPMVVEDILSTTARFFRFHLRDKDDDVTVYTADDVSGISWLGPLEVMDVYEELYLVVHTVLEDGVSPSHTFIPVYLPITVAMAVGRKDGRRNLFYETMAAFHRTASESAHDYEPLLRELSDIMVFDEAPDGGDYEHIPCQPLTSGPDDQGAVKPPEGATTGIEMHPLASSTDTTTTTAKSSPAKLRTLPPHLPKKPRKLKEKNMFWRWVRKRRKKASANEKENAAGDKRVKPLATAQHSGVPLSCYETLTLREELSNLSVGSDDGSQHLILGVMDTFKVIKEIQATITTGLLPWQRGIFPPDPSLDDWPLESGEAVSLVEEHPVDDGPPPPIPPRQVRGPDEALLRQSDASILPIDAGVGVGLGPDDDLPQHGRDQFRHSEDPLRHSEEPLRHSEDPLRHSEDPLRHSEDPLRHSEDPLRHSEDPLRHSEDPLRHSEDPLRHSEEPLCHSGDQLRHNEDQFRHSEELLCHNGDQFPLRQAFSEEFNLPHGGATSSTAIGWSSRFHQQKGAPQAKARRLGSAAEPDYDNLDPEGKGIQLPADVGALTVRGVGQCLRLLNLAAYVDALEEAQVDGNMLSLMSREMLREDFGMREFHALKLHRFAVSGWRPKC